MFTPDVIHKIVHAIGIAPGSVVLLQFWGEDEDRATLHAFEAAVAAADAAPFAMQQSRRNNAVLFASMTQSVFTDRYFDILAPVNVVIDIFMQPPVVPGEDMPEKALPLYRAYMRGLFDRLGGVDTFVQVRVPTAANAAESGLSPEAFVARMARAYDIDYAALRAACREKVSALEGKASATVYTDGCMLTLSLAGRVWHVDAGDGDFPCGEVYAAPIEAATNGTVRFAQLRLPEGFFEDVVLTVEAGIITGCTHAGFKALLSALPKGGNVVCELGLGMNPGIDALVGYPVLDEKMAGTFHLGLGMNLPFGGTNEAPCHMDLVGTGKVVFA